MNLATVTPCSKLRTVQANHPGIYGPETSTDYWRRLVMTFKHVRTGVRLLALGAVAWVLLGVAYVGIVIAANW
ncbi:Hypothetical protein ROUS_38 [Brevibacterium phage Rousseau]|nr:Hypothetical protein ROUS_38 [Brevibacterium phage Rousseau]